MMPMRTIVTAAAVLLAPPSIACAGQAISLDGSYEMTTRLELPHVERWAVDQTTKICLAGAPGGDAIPIPIPIPVLSANNPFASCAATNLTIDRGHVEYEIVCPGRASARAHASYIIGSGGFHGAGRDGDGCEEHAHDRGRPRRAGLGRAITGA